jgi:hypothetical protein
MIIAEISKTLPFNFFYFIIFCDIDLPLSFTSSPLHFLGRHFITQATPSAPHSLFLTTVHLRAFA